jgi:hypothetical protein
MWEQLARSAVAKLDLPAGWPVAVVRHEFRGGRPEPHLHLILPLIGDNGSRLPNPPSPFRIMQIAAELEKEFDLKITPGLKKKGN